MNTEDLGKSKILNLLFKPAGVMMGSKVRQWLSDPVKTLRGADIKPGQTVLEVGCGTGFFTIPAAQLIGDQGCLVAMDVSSGFIEQVSKKVQLADLKNVRIVKRDHRTIHARNNCPTKRAHGRWGFVPTKWLYT
jgi:demethylmenaquinone methyltransferase/2-methoxy-6-polyprenyl-1,4-benzoquinol methylase